MELSGAAGRCPQVNAVGPTTAKSSRGEMNFVNFDRARNRLHSRAAGGQAAEQKKGRGEAKERVYRLQSAARLPTSSGNERNREKAAMRRFDHIDLRVKEQVAAERFYARILPELGFTKASTSAEWHVWQAPRVRAGGIFRLHRRA